jgi:hypothetical protein
VKSSVNDLVEAMLTQSLDSPLKAFGFARRKRSTVYLRQREEARQSIDVAYDAAPTYAPRADAHLLPALRILLPRVTAVAQQMVGDDRDVLGTAAATLFEPIDFVAPQKETPRWLPAGIEDFLKTGDEINAFIQIWVLPFLDEYASTEAFVNGYEKDDARLLLTQSSYLDVTAAYVVLERIDDAARVLEKHLGKPGLRKQYASAFAYIERQRR